MPLNKIPPWLLITYARIIQICVHRPIEWFEENWLLGRILVPSTLAAKIILYVRVLPCFNHYPSTLITFISFPALHLHAYLHTCNWQSTRASCTTLSQNCRMEMTTFAIACRHWHHPARVCIDRKLGDDYWVGPIAGVGLSRASITSQTVIYQAPATWQTEHAPRERNTHRTVKLSLLRCNSFLRFSGPSWPVPTHPAACDDSPDNTCPTGSYRSQ